MKCSTRLWLPHFHFAHWRRNGGACQPGRFPVGKLGVEKGAAESLFIGNYLDPGEEEAMHKEALIVARAQFSLKFILAHPAVNCVLTETTDPEHAVDNLGAGFGRLPDERQQQLMLDVIRGIRSYDPVR